MMSVEKPDIASETKNSPEEMANFEGNDTLLLFERLSNPTILGDLVTTLRAGYVARAASGRPVQKTELDERGEDKRNPDGSLILVEEPYEVPTEDDVREQILSRIEEAGSVTNISFGEGSPTAGCIPIHWRLLDGAIPTDKQKSIMEAHEKGHNVRILRGGHEGEEFYIEMFSRAFDFSEMSYTDEEYQNDKERIEKHEQEMFGHPHDREIGFEEVKKIMVGYMSDPMELMERMSQLKNYFGFKGDERFTLEHLRYAREHYIEDTGFNNHMDKFFEGIKDDKEFVRLMNEIGI